MLSKRVSRKALLICGSAILLIVVIAVAIGLSQLTREVTLTVDGTTGTFETRADTVKELLEEKDVTLSAGDEVLPLPNQDIEKGTHVTVTRAVNITLKADGSVNTYRVVPMTVGEVLSHKLILLGNKDIIKPAVGKTINNGTRIVINRILTKEKTVTKTVDYKIAKKKDSGLADGATRVLRKGVKGKEKVTYKITYSDGKPIKKEAIARQTIKKPVSKLVAVGTKVTVTASRGDGRDSFNYKDKMTVKAYAYSSGSHTATGTRVREGVIAVDPTVIPLGTAVYVEGYGFAKAEDTGGDIKGNTIDIFMNSESACNRWGVRYVKLYIL